MVAGGGAQSTFSISPPSSLAGRGTRVRQSPRRLVSIVVPCYNEEAVFALLGTRLVDLANSLSEDYSVELLFVDDGSRDRTWDLIRELARRDSRVRGVSLSRNFGHQVALSCAYDLARGDAVLSIDADLQDPPDVIPKLLQKWHEGADIVYAVRQRRQGETFFKLWTAATFYRLLRFLGAKRVKADSGDFRLMSRRSLVALNSMREQHRFVRGMVGWLGFREAEVQYERQPRAAGETKYPFTKMLQLAADAAVSFSMAPLRMTYLFAASLSGAILSYLIYVGIKVLFFHEQPVRGWASLLLAVMGFGALILICLGILGEYVGRIYEQVKARPLYLIKDVTCVESANGGFHDSTRDRWPVEGEEVAVDDDPVGAPSVLARHAPEHEYGR
jgi:polyisoprenyl-phosphate glycosyltransferase